MRLCLFEDAKSEDFHPLSLTRPVFCLRMGMEELYRRDARITGVPLGGVFTRPHLAATTRRAMQVQVDSTKALGRDDLLLLNGRVLDPEKIQVDGNNDEVGMRGTEIVYVRAGRQTVKRSLDPDFNEFLRHLVGECDQVEAKATMANHIWDLVLGNGRALADDFRRLGRSGIVGRMEKGSFIVGDEALVYVAPSARIDPLVVLDTTGGPIYVDEGVRVFPNTRIEGPAFIGKNSHIVGGKVREGCSIGPACRIGGEVEESIFHGFSNKYHSGFIGHSYIGEWVNLGALTTNSDLKNDYSEVQVFLRGRLVDTSKTKIGSAIADHVKTGIGTLLNTGTVVGVMSILMPSGDVSPKNIPSFCLLHRNRIRGGLGFESLIETARKTMSRRGVQLLDEEVDMLRRVFEMTSDERETLIRRDRRKRARS